ncbi:hypothetical protein G7Y79_00041g077880 [Physcia stellaris]|nr:hypothetical protein G7Y79_00041g077880 [Physcia stellaris]
MYARPRLTSTKKTRTFNKPASVEKLPSEIGLLILHQIPDRGSLGNLIHASPAYHRLYLTIREEIFTKLTIRELVSRGFDPFSENNVIKVLVDPGPYVYYHVNQPPLDIDIWDAARELYKQCQHQSQVAGSGKGRIVKSSISACLSLLNIIDSRGWRFDCLVGPKETSVKVTCTSSSGLQEVFHQDPNRYHVIVLADWQEDMRILARLADDMLYHLYVMLHVEDPPDDENDGCERSLSFNIILHDGPGI